ncbi:MAG: winged helix DNA-binding domain-containing protein [Clostridia bacterium]|nr:winged helix DNA-binding domain-containing protein [Clostridia bacterium]
MQSLRQGRRIGRRAAIRFLLDWHGLAGARRYAGAGGMLAHIRRVGCIQFDPLDICGRNAELALHARVKGFTPALLHDALYKARTLVDYWDKNMSIFPMEDWPCFFRERQQFRERPSSRSREHVEPALEEVRAQIDRRGPLFSADIDLGKRVDWSWSPTTLSRAAMETLYFTGDLAIHRRQGVLRAFDLAERLVPPALYGAGDPFPDAQRYEAWRVHRRIGGVGLVWARPGDAYLGIPLESPGTGRKAALAQIIRTLTAEGRVFPVEIEGVPGIGEPCFVQAEALETLEQAMQGRAKRKRTEFLAPLDNMLWDRRLIEALFGFAYRWEVYTPAAQRKYGYYVLPVLQGEALTGRIEVVRDRRARCLRVQNAWWERKTDPEGVRDCLDRHARMLGLDGWEGGIGL